MKTAKEMADRAIITEPIWDNPYNIPTKSVRFYRFTPAEFKAFCERLCEEQRELCAESAQAYSDHDDVPYVSKGSIQSAPSPDLGLKGEQP